MPFVFCVFPSQLLTMSDHKTLFDTIPDGLNVNVTGWLVYDDAKDLPEPQLVDDLDPFDDITLVPFDKEPLYGEPDQTVHLEVIMDNLNDGAN